MHAPRVRRGGRAFSKLVGTKERGRRPRATRSAATAAAVDRSRAAPSVARLLRRGIAVYAVVVLAEQAIVVRESHGQRHHTLHVRGAARLVAVAGDVDVNRGLVGARPRLDLEDA